MKDRVFGDEGRTIEICFLFRDSIRETLETMSFGKIEEAKKMLGIVEEYMSDMIFEHFNSIKLISAPPKIISYQKPKYHEFRNVIAAN